MSDRRRGARSINYLPPCRSVGAVGAGLGQSIESREQEETPGSSADLADLPCARSGHTTWSTEKLLWTAAHFLSSSKRGTRPDFIRRAIPPARLGGRRGRRPRRPVRAPSGRRRG